MTEIVDEFREGLVQEALGASFVDKRLAGRLAVMVGSASERPWASFPVMMGSEAGLEACYRFMNNPRVTPERILAPFVLGTVERCAGHGRLLVVHDTTEFSYKREQPPEGMGLLKAGGVGFLAHFSLVVSPHPRGVPMGVVGMELVNRTGEKKGKPSRAEALADGSREFLRWTRAVEVSHKALTGHELVHVADREGDAYELMDSVAACGDKFVIRVAHDRVLGRDADRKAKKLFDLLPVSEVLFEREVYIPSRSVARKAPKAKKINPERSARHAKLLVSALAVTIPRPEQGLKTWAASMDVNVVHVCEATPPDGQDPVEWKLVTTLPVTTAEEVAAVVDAYRQRWTIEEYFKALKTGCAFGTRQFESFHALTNTLAMLAPVAWRLLMLRDFGRSQPDLPAAVVVTPTEIQVLRVLGRTELPAHPTLGHVMWAIAALGGHLRRNGPPGWQTLARGLEDLGRLTAAWTAAKNHA